MGEAEGGDPLGEISPSEAGSPAGSPAVGGLHDGSGGRGTGGAGEAGYPQTYDIDEITTRMPTPAEVNRLQIPAGPPIAEHIRTGYTDEGQAVRVTN